MSFEDCVHCNDTTFCEECYDTKRHKKAKSVLKSEKASFEADPTGKRPSDPGAKLDAGKPRASLLRQVGLALLEVAKVLTIGAEKYSANGWIAVPNGEVRYDDAFWRHILYAATEAVDKDTGLPHDVQEAVNALFKLELRLRREKNAE